VAERPRPPTRRADRGHRGGLVMHPPDWQPDLVRRTQRSACSGLV